MQTDRQTDRQTKGQRAKRTNDDDDDALSSPPKLDPLFLSLPLSLCPSVCLALSSALCLFTSQSISLTHPLFLLSWSLQPCSIAIPLPLLLSFRPASNRHPAANDMGQTLSAPITEKHSSSGHDKRFAYGASAMQGWRISMEDAHTTLLEVEDAEGTAFFAVYDGHGGPNVAKYSGDGLHKKIVADKAFAKGDYFAAIKGGFLEMDRALRFDPEYGNDMSGCTAITATFTNKDVLYVGNAGDSRAVLSTDGAGIALSNDHKPMNAEETRRIVAAGGFVEYGRVNGNLALSRALGDFEFKTNATLGPDDQIVTANPAIVEHKITSDDEFLILACDGIWDCMSSQEAVTYVRKHVAEKIPLETICEMAMDHCLASDSGMTGIGCDNMTMVVVAILNGKTLEEWYEFMASRVAVRLGPADSRARPNGDEDPETLKENAEFSATSTTPKDSEEATEKNKDVKDDKEEQKDKDVKETETAA